MRQIPATGGIADPSARKSIDAIKENIEDIRGGRGNKIAALDPATATLSDVAKKVNEILAVLQV
jgi:hypothetical protein